MPAGEIRKKLDAFIRKYYLNQLLRGALLFMGISLALFLAISLGEYYFYFNKFIRAFLLYSFLAVFGYVLFRYVAIPLKGLYRLGRVISYEHAARIIGAHFTDVKDRLLNLLQLDEMQRAHPDSGLVAAGIAQRTQELRPVPFARAINFNGNKKYIKYALLPLSLFLCILVFQSSILLDSSKRVLNYDRDFARVAPFRFVIKNQELQAERGADVDIVLDFDGISIPSEAYLVYRDQKLKMEKREDGYYHYDIRNLQQNESFRFFAAEFFSGEYELQALPVPTVTGVEAILNYPAYTGRVPEKISNSTDFTVPEGTDIEWRFNTRDAKELLVMGLHSSERLQPDRNGTHFTLRKRFMGRERFNMLLKNGNTPVRDTLRYTIEAVADNPPSIIVEKREDSANVKQFYFIGNASDDYGISAVRMVYRFVKAEEGAKLLAAAKTVPVQIQGGRDIPFGFALNMDMLGMAPADEVEYWFEAWDNDGIHGSKVSRTQAQMIRRQSIEELKKESEQRMGAVKNMMSDAMKQSKELEQEMKELQNRFNAQKNLNWEDREKLKEAVEKQQKLEELKLELQQENQKLQAQQSEFQKKNEELQKRQEELNKLMKEMENPELKKLLEEIQKLLEKQAPKEQLNQKMQQIQQMDKEAAKELDKLMEQFKQLQLEQKLQENIEQIDKLAQKQEALKKETEEGKKEQSEGLKQKQNELKEELNKLAEEMKKAEEMNKGMEQPMELDMGEKEQQEAGEKMDAAVGELDKKKNEKAVEEQKDAVEKLKEMSDKVKKSLETEKEKRVGEDYQKIRELLENLVETSFQQESIFTELNKLKEYNPRYVELNRRQMKVKEDCAMIEDSLMKIAKRQPLIASFVTKEINRINTNMEYALDNLKVRNLHEAGKREQYVMTGLNNLAVMLMESMQDMQNQMNAQSKSQGKKSCKNPNGQGQGNKQSNKKGPGKMSKGQEQLGQMLQDMQKKAQEGRGQQPGEGKPGEGKPGEGKGGGQQGDKAGKEMNKDYARMALMQEALRRQLQALREQLEKQGDGAAAKELRKTEQMMEQQEKELVNKRMTPDMIKRQKDIETRMLEHEKSERKQEQDEQREANRPTDAMPSLPPELQEYIKQKQKERELLRQAPPELSGYFREKVKEYLRVIR